MENRLYTDEMYDLALQYRKTKLWKKLSDTQLFAVRHEDGTVGFCCVMGKAGETLALAVYPEGEGLQTYLRLAFDENEDDGEDRLLYQEKTLNQDCVSLVFDAKYSIPRERLEWVMAYCERKGVTLRGKWAYPDMLRMEPRRAPWEITDETRMAHLRDGIRAALEVSRRLETETAKQIGLLDIDDNYGSCPLLTRVDGGYEWSRITFPLIRRPLYPEANLLDSPEIEQARKKRARAKCVWAARVFPFVTPMTLDESVPEGETPQTAPTYPYMYVLIDIRNRLILAVNLCADEPEYASGLLNAIINASLHHEKPERILVMDERTHVLLGQVEAKLGITVERRARIEELSEALDEVISRFSDAMEDTDDADVGMDDVFDAIAAQPELLRDLPDVLLKQMVALAEQGMIPLHVQVHVMKEAKRRKL